MGPRHLRRGHPYYAQAGAHSDGELLDEELRGRAAPQTNDPLLRYLVQGGSRRHALHILHEQPGYELSRPLYSPKDVLNS
jgi:hypothetical protein